MYATGRRSDRSFRNSSYRLCNMQVRSYSEGTRQSGWSANQWSVTLKVEHGATTTCVIAHASGPWHVSIRRLVSGVIDASSCTKSTGGRPPLDHPGDLLAPDARSQAPTFRAATFRVSRRHPFGERER